MIRSRQVPPRAAGDLGKRGRNPGFASNLAVSRHEGGSQKIPVICLPNYFYCQAQPRQDLIVVKSLAQSAFQTTPQELSGIIDCNAYRSLRSLSHNLTISCSVLLSVNGKLFFPANLCNTVDMPRGCRSTAACFQSPGLLQSDCFRSETPALPFSDCCRVPTAASDVPVREYLPQ